MVNSIPPNTHFNPFTEASSEFSSSGSSTSDLSKLESSLQSGNMENARRLLGSFSQKLQHLAVASGKAGSSGVSSALSKLIDGVNSNKPDLALQGFAELKSALKSTLEDHVGHNDAHDKNNVSSSANHDAPSRNPASGKVRGGFLDVKA